MVKKKASPKRSSRKTPPKKTRGKKTSKKTSKRASKKVKKVTKSCKMTKTRRSPKRSRSRPREDSDHSPYSPPQYNPRKCKGMIIKGGDNKLYLSKKGSDGVYKWKRVKF